MTHAAMAQFYRDDNMTDHIDDEADGKGLDGIKFYDLLEMVAANARGEEDTDLRLKALDRALSYQAICAKNNLSTDGTVKIASTFLAFLKGE